MARDATVHTHFLCSVCFDAPPGRTEQCVAGHLICAHDPALSGAEPCCLARLLACAAVCRVPATCPECRAPLPAAEGERITPRTYAALGTSTLGNVHVQAEEEEGREEDEEEGEEEEEEDNSLAAAEVAAAASAVAAKAAAVVEWAAEVQAAAAEAAAAKSSRASYKVLFQFETDGLLKIVYQCTRAHSPHLCRASSMYLGS